MGCINTTGKILLLLRPAFYCWYCVTITIQWKAHFLYFIDATPFLYICPDI